MFDKFAGDQPQLGKGSLKLTYCLRRLQLDDQCSNWTAHTQKTEINFFESPTIEEIEKFAETEVPYKILLITRPDTSKKDSAIRDAKGSVEDAQCKYALVAAQFLRCRKIIVAVNTESNQTFRAESTRIATIAKNHDIETIVVPISMRTGSNVYTLTPPWFFGHLYGRTLIEAIENLPSPYVTIFDTKDFNALLFAEKIDCALRAGDKDGVVKVLTSISNAQRQQLREPYKIKYGKGIIEALNEKFSGDLEKIIFALMDTPRDYDVKQLKAAMKELGTDEAVLIEILCSRTVDQLRAIRVTYENQFEKSLDADIAEDTSGEFRDLLVSLVTGAKDGSHDTNDVQAEDDAVRLFADGKAKLAKKDGTHFLHILATQNQYQLRKVFHFFEELSGSSIEKAIEKEFSGDLQKSYLTIVRAASDKQKFFAQQLYASMKGLGTRDNDLIRVIVTRSEVDLELIKTEFTELYKKSLADMVKGDTSGAYRDALIAIINGNHATAH